MLIYLISVASALVFQRLRAELLNIVHWIGFFTDLVLPTWLLIIQDLSKWGRVADRMMHMHRSGCILPVLSVEGLVIY